MKHVPNLRSLQYLSTVQQLPTITDEEIPHLGAEEVIEEVFILMGRLETDRADTVTSYKKEQKRVEWLQGRIDALAWKRMKELAKAVQNGMYSLYQNNWYLQLSALSHELRSEWDKLLSHPVEYKAKQTNSPQDSSE